MAIIYDSTKICFGYWSRIYLGLFLVCIYWLSHIGHLCLILLVVVSVIISVIISVVDIPIIVCIIWLVWTWTLIDYHSILGPHRCIPTPNASNNASNNTDEDQASDNNNKIDPPKTPNIPVPIIAGPCWWIRT